MNIVQLINISISAAGLALCGLGLVMSIADRSMENKLRRYFIAFFSLLVGYVTANFLGQWSYGVAYQMMTLYLESALSSMLTLLLMGFLLELSGEADWRRNTVFRIAVGLWLIYILLLTSTWFSNRIYYFDAKGIYHRGLYYPALLLLPICIMLLNLHVLWRRWSRFSKRERAAFAVYIIAPMVCMLIQLFFFGVYLIVLGTSIAALLMLAYILTDQAERFYRQEAENERLRTEIMLSQIQPHFLNNTLGAIGYLCRDNPEAKAAVTKFARYLQGNMDSLSQTEPIPFATELEHTKAYLELEQLRFREKLRVVYDLEATDFLLPTLTLQPLVENAVFHGVRGNPDGRGTVAVSSREYPDRYEITVADDGPGFDPDVAPPDDGETHIGLQNVRARLGAVGGTLRVDSAPGQGCRVKIALPKEAKSC